MKKIMALVLVLALSLSLASVSLAADDVSAESVVPTRGSSFPTSGTTLPYNMSDAAKIYHYTYTAKYFKPTSSQKIKVRFYGEYTSPTLYELALADGLNSFVPTTIRYTGYPVRSR